uniref:F-box domain-containing protein n=1 Tax=Fagus sylvatica TaxID=28930 RepID=A0A2N9I8T2_FAGSY
MKSKSKRQKISYQVEYEDSVSSRRHNILKKDRISNLPYNVLRHILSFLPTKHAVGTSILSTKWKNLWTSVPNLDFEDDLLLQGRRPGNESIGDLRVSFLSFVDRVLILHNAPHIHRFRLKCGQNFKSSHVNAWIYAALLRYAQELDLCVPMKNYKSLHCDLFRSKSVVYLKLDEYNTELCEYKIVIDAPNLEYLRLFDYVAEGYHLKNLNSLTEAQVHVDLSTRKLEQMGHAYYGQQVLELIKGIHNVKVLHLTGDSMEALKLSSCDLPTLHNVSHLEIDVNKNIGWQLLPDLLKSVPNLQALYFGMGLERKRGGAEYEGSISSIRQNIFKKAIVQEEEDRISNLPYKVLCHILSFLPTKYAVGTSILSTKWKTLWTSVPNLDFEDDLLIHGRRPGNASIKDLRVTFSSFVDRVLNLNNAPHIHRVRVKCGQNYKPSHVNAWIDSALWRNVQELDLCVPMRNYKSLHCEGEYNTEFCEYRIIIDTPTLEYFRLHDYVAEGYDLKNLKSLTEAEVHVDLSTQKLEQMSHAYYGQAVLKLIKGICSVKFLHLTGDSMEALKSSGCDLPMLHNVSHLKLNVNRHIGWQLLPDLLKSLPNLLALYFPMGLVHKWGGDCQWHPPEWVPCCLLFRLKKISIWEFQGKKGEFKMVKYLLQNARVLRMFRIRTNHLTKEEELKITKELLLLPRGSVTCQVVCS